MSLGTNSLLAYCTQLCENTRGGLDWLLANEAELKQDLAGPVRELRKAVVEGRRLQRAAGRKMCVGVFGPSQTGKSYLISALAREGTKPVMADFGGDYVDFLADINPQGGKESTGLVTRFTIDRPDSVPPGYPVELRLLTETDVVKVLANSYVFDVNRDDEDEASHSVEAIQTLLARLEGRARAETVGTLDPVDIVDLEEYCNRRLVKSPRVKVLRRTDFWRVATRIAHRLDGSDRSELFAIIWDGLPAFTNVYRRLHLVLERFDFAESVFASYDALRDRATSIITVDTLAGIGEGRGDGVEVTTRLDSPFRIALWRKSRGPRARHGLAGCWCWEWLPAAATLLGYSRLRFLKVSDDEAGGLVVMLCQQLDREIGIAADHGIADCAMLTQLVALHVTHREPAITAHGLGQRSAQAQHQLGTGGGNDRFMKVLVDDLPARHRLG